MSNLAKNDISSFWKPYSAKRQFHKVLRLFVAADRMHDTTDDEQEVFNITNTGLKGAIELKPDEDEQTKRAFSAFLEACDQNLLIRTTGDIIAFLPPLNIWQEEIDFIFETLGGELKTIQ